MPVYLQKGSIMLWNNTPVTEHNRDHLDVKVNRIESSKRTANGLIRKYVIADKRTWSTSWTTLPDLTTSTVDGQQGGLWIENFYNTTRGAFTLKVMPLGSVVLTTGTSIITTSSPHKLNVGDTVQLGTIATTTGVLANTTYYVISTPTNSTLTISAVLGGSLLVFTNTGSAASLGAVFTVVFSEFHKSIKKRVGLYNDCDISVSLEEV